MQHFRNYIRLSSAELNHQGTQHQQSGFTLLEMVLVLFLVGLLASAGLLFTEGVEEQAKYDETKRRMELIRKAIVGDPTRTINGAPEISGFAADMGRLPLCLAELLTPGEISGVPADNSFISPCSSEVEVKGWQIADETNIGHGWRGPYIQTLADRNGDVRFRDGYGNDDDTEDFGWQWQLFDKDDAPLAFTEADNAVRASLQSLGFDALDAADDIPHGDISAISSLIVENDWKIKSLDVTFKNTSDQALPATESNLLLRIYKSRLTDYVDGSPEGSDFLTLAASSVSPEIPRTETFTFTEPDTVVQGVRAYAVVCHEDPPADPDDFVIFDGGCDSNIKPDSSNIRKFSVVPRNSLNLQFDWIIPTP